MDALVEAAIAAAPAALPACAPAAAAPSLVVPAARRAPLNSRCTEEERWSIVALHKDGRSHKYIVDRLKVHRGTVRRHPRGEALNPEFCVPKLAHPVKVNVWACFCAAGVGYCHIFNETLDAPLMKSILKDNLIASAQLHFNFDPPEQWYLLHDNDKKFTAGLVQEYLHSIGVTTIEFPPYSPDLNPIENLWNSVQRQVDKRACSTMEELQDVVAEEWGRVKDTELQKLVESMPARCKAVREANGWHTKY